MDDAMKQHLREEHGLHEATEGAVHTDDITMYGSGLEPAALMDLHRQHHDEHSDLLTHSHSDEE